VRLTAARIRELLNKLNEELERRGVRGEAYLAGGAVMCLVFQAREATKDIDAMIVPAAQMREAARAVGEREELPAAWLNDAVKGFFSERGQFEEFEDFGYLRVYVPCAGYLLAMKCLALRMGEEYQDASDVAVLLRELKVRTVAEAEAILGKYYDLNRYPAKARYILEELLASGAQEQRPTPGFLE
jgi:hypothetical protein